MLDHSSGILDSANDRSLIPVSPNAPGLQNYPTIVTSTPSPGSSDWGSNNLQQQTANMSSWCRCRGPQAPGGEQPRTCLCRQPPRQSGGFYSHTQATRQIQSLTSMSYPCLVEGCSQSFSRTDYRGNHLRKQHNLPIPKGSWAHTWISRTENQHHLSKAVAEQARALLAHVE